MSKSIKALIDKYQQNCDRMQAMADVLVKEKRERNEAETSEYNALVRENEILSMQMNAAKGAAVKSNDDFKRSFREALESGKQFTINVQTRENVLSSNVEAGGLVPLKIQDILDPLSEGLIISKLGLPMPVGLSGTYQWPVWDVGEAEILGEGVEADDTALTLDKMTAAPERIAVKIPVSREALIQSDNAIENIITRAIPLSVSRLLNKIILSTTKLTNATNLVGPFVGLTAGSLSATPTFKEFCKMKASILKTGIDGGHLCWVMTQDQKAVAESTPKDAGSGIMICENDHIAGLPVFCSQYIGENNVGLGDFLYQPMGLFGQVSILVDPYTLAGSGLIRFVFNADYATKTLRKEAFALSTVKTSA